ncbi:hypothetical protein NDU88_006490 [Pleurodeles waltl]|uniref:Uncharacterized protein n=1 Tax=Pleurodeles waltl TaxID=8319 RepID=A0AAV7L3V7_PLEWA|nr:hypothetical protein NDU88_006490 [Pleurodeles waltl]
MSHRGALVLASNSRHAPRPCQLPVARGALTVNMATPCTHLAPRATRQGLLGASRGFFAVPAAQEQRGAVLTLHSRRPRDVAPVAQAPARL